MCARLVAPLGCDVEAGEAPQGACLVATIAAAARNFERTVESCARGIELTRLEIDLSHHALGFAVELVMLHVTSDANALLQEIAGFGMFGAPRANLSEVQQPDRLAYLLTDAAKECERFFLCGAGAL